MDRTGTDGGGLDMRAGGLDMGTGGLDMGTGGLDMGSGGLDIRTGGLDIRTGGLDIRNCCLKRRGTRKGEEGQEGQEGQTTRNKGQGPLSPPYWQLRLPSDSSLSTKVAKQKRLSGSIRLEDHSEESSETYNAVWSKSVTVHDFTVVGAGVGPALGSYVVWNCTIETLNGSTIKLRKRYSDFDKLRKNLVKTFPSCGASLPELPRKSFVHRFQPKFLEQRKDGIAYFLNCVLLNPEFSSSPVLKDFIFAQL
ncbi:PX-domain-containing protein [Venturia nashicola]|nr:PX-domain-containing protein [Venturia nashicola]